MQIHIAWDYPCDYEQVNVKIAYNEGGMILIEYQPQIRRTAVTR